MMILRVQLHRKNMKSNEKYNKKSKIEMAETKKLKETAEKSTNRRNKKLPQKKKKKENDLTKTEKKNKVQNPVDRNQT